MGFQLPSSPHAINYMQCMDGYARVYTATTDVLAVAVSCPGDAAWW
jgi:hypothetical protein